MDPDKGAARQLARYTAFATPGDSRDLPSSRLPSPVRALPPRLVVARVLREAPFALANRKSQIASALDSLPVPSAESLQEYFDLTSAEVKLAQSLARGLSLEEAARHLTIKMSTARTQLASIFAKTDSQRQGKLIAILSRIAHMS
jgi:DNA-binding CsgD family transcriptional regulator